MKRLNWIGILTLCLCWGVCMRGYTADITSLPTSGNWTGGTWKGNANAITLTGNIKLSGTIIISSGKTLYIKANANRTITNDTNNLAGMFKVESGGKLIIEGSDNGRITIDGGANFGNWNPTDGVYLPVGTSSKTLTQAAIYNQGTLTMKYATIRNVKRDSGSGGGIYITGSKITNGPTTLENCIIEKCMSGHGSALHITTQTPANNTAKGCAVTLKNTKVQYCYASATDGGGTIRTNGAASAQLTLDGVEVCHNRSNKYGGAVYWNAGGITGTPNGEDDTKCIIKGSKFHHNSCPEIGGALMLETSFEFQAPISEIYNNTAGTNGGGIVITGYQGGGIPGGTFNFNLSEHLEIYGNHAKNGGGVAFNLENVSYTEITELNARMIGASIHNNTADEYGGGIFMFNTIPEDKTWVTVNMYFNKGTLSNNHAKNGGGFYITDQDISNNAATGESLKLEGNTASEDGGGIYSRNNSVTLKTIAVTGNIAKANGGGLCIKNGTFTMQAGSEINNNTATNGNGGGLYINSTSGTVTCSGGTFIGNHAKAGGGACIDGALTVALDATLEDNEATNGGGIYLANGATLNFGTGLIRSNKAESTTSLNTAYQGTAANVSGIGGGIFLADNTTLTFTNTAELGIYKNSASNGADDIFANGNGTNITLPVIENMSLKGFDVPASKLYWVEDYVSGDENYDKGTNLKTSGSVNRYQYALQQGLDTWELGDNYISPNVLNKYACLTLSYELIYVTLKKINLKKNDDAIFTISYQDKNTGVSVPYRKLIFTGTGSDVEKVVALPSGKWKFEESSVWGKKYKPLSAEWIEITKTNNIVTVTNTAIDDYDATIEAEHRVVNRLVP